MSVWSPVSAHVPRTQSAVLTEPQIAARVKVVPVGVRKDDAVARRAFDPPREADVRYADADRPAGAYGFGHGAQAAPR